MRDFMRDQFAYLPRFGAELAKRHNSIKSRLKFHYAVCVELHLSSTYPATKRIRSQLSRDRDNASLPVGKSLRATGPHEKQFNVFQTDGIILITSRLLSSTGIVLLCDLEQFQDILSLAETGSFD